MAATITDAVCIRQWDWSETSQTVSLFTRDLGLVRALAKGAKRPKANFSGGIGLLTRGQASLIVKPNAELALLTAWDLEETFSALRSTLAAHHAGMYMADLINHSVTDRDPHPALFDAFLENLRALGKAGAIPPALLRFQWATLLETGYRPVLEADVVSGEELPEAKVYLFDPELGGVLAGDPESGEALSPSGRRPWRVRAETLSLLRATATGETTAAGDTTIDRANRLLAAYLRHIFGREPHTLALVFGDDLPT